MDKKTKTFVSFRVKLLRWFVGISLCTLIVVGTAVYFNSYFIISQRIKSELNILGMGITAKVETFIDGKKGRVLDFCSDGYVKDALTNYDHDDPEAEDLVKQTNQHLLKNKFPLDPYLEDIIILNLKGKVLFSTSEKNLNKDKSKEDYFLEISRSFKSKEMLERFKNDPSLFVFVTDLYLDQDFGRPILSISNLITARATGLPLGILVNRYKGEMLHKLLETEADILGKGGKAYIVNRKGSLLTAPEFAKKINQEVILKTVLKTQPILMAQEKDKNMLGLYTDSRKIKVLGASHITKKNGWIILAEKDAREAFFPLFGLIFTVGIIGLLSAVVVFLISLLISRKIAAPILKVSEVAEIIAKGDLTADLKMETQDEVSVSFENIITTIHDIVSETRFAADKLVVSAEQLSSSSQEMNASNQQISTAISSVAGGAGKQAEKTAQTLEAMKIASVTLNQVVSNAQAVSAAVSKTSERVQKGKSAAQEVVDKIVQLTETVVETSKIIQGLEEKSQAIGEITNTITSIADQTNLLALNAAIEAARAGESGRGFAVVAEEVRKLAEGSAKAVKKIDTLIKYIQFETKNADTAISVSSEEAKKGTAEVTKIVDVLDDITVAVQEVNTLAAQISSSIQRQVTENELVNKAVKEVDSIAKESAATAQEVSSSTQEQTAAMQEMSASSQVLSNLAVNLNNLVSKFKVHTKS